MKTIRVGTFETNSSSSHSITISSKEMIIPNNFPRNNHKPFILSQTGDVSYSDDKVDIKRLRAEIEKAGFMLNLIATYIENNDDEYPEITYIHNPNNLYSDHEEMERNGVRRSFANMIKQEPFVWLIEVIEKETGTKILIEEPDSTYFPYFDTPYDDNESIKDVVQCDWHNELSFKTCVHNIIFNDDIVITVANIPYGMEFDYE